MLRPRRPVCQNRHVNPSRRLPNRPLSLRALSALAAIVACLLMAAAPAVAHEVRPALVQIEEATDGAIEVTWKQPVAGDVGVRLAPRLSGGGLDRAPDRETLTDAYRVRIWNLPPGQDLSGQTLSVDGLSMTVTDVLVRVKTPEAEVSSVLKPANPSLRLDLGGPAGAAVPAYLRLGIEHILMGVDHLAFVLGLLLLIGLNLGVVKAVTAFTVAHSVTLAATALGLVQADPAVVEVLVALSIVFVAVELAAAPGSAPTVTRRWPWLVALAFGLLHGFAFAGALAQIGLPKEAAPQALLLFNIGVEIGQLLFLGAAALVILALRRIRPRLPWLTDGMARLGPAYVIGGLSAYWLVERIAGVF